MWEPPCRCGQLTPPGRAGVPNSTQAGQPSGAGNSKGGFGFRCKDSRKQSMCVSRKTASVRHQNSIHEQQDWQLESYKIENLFFKNKFKKEKRFCLKSYCVTGN